MVGPAVLSLALSPTTIHKLYNIKIFLELQSIRWQSHNPGFLILYFKDWGGISQIPYTKFIRLRRTLAGSTFYFRFSPFRCPQISVVQTFSTALMFHVILGVNKNKYDVPKLGSLIQ